MGIAVSDRAERPDRIIHEARASTHQPAGSAPAAALAGADRHGLIRVSAPAPHVAPFVPALSVPNDHGFEIIGGDRDRSCAAVAVVAASQGNQIGSQRLASCWLQGLEGAERWTIS